jgi:hypothetical protein
MPTRSFFFFITQARVRQDGAVSQGGRIEFGADFPRSLPRLGDDSIWAVMAIRRVLPVGPTGDQDSGRVSGGR